MGCRRSDTLAADLDKVLNDADAPPALTRVAVSVIGDRDPGPAEAGHAIAHLTFRPEGGRFREDTVVRGLHPMIARRLQLWRLANFRIDPLPRAPGTYLFHCVAQGQPGRGAVHRAWPRSAT